MARRPRARSLTISAQRQQLLAQVTDAVPTPGREGAVVVAVDGVDGAGKTVFADELGRELAARDRSVQRASIDDFLHPTVVRYRRGRSSPEGFWLDSYDYTRFEAEVLDPFRRSAAGALLVVDGIFLHRDELVRHWDSSVFLDVSFETAYARMNKRDGCPALPEHPANRRYLDGQRLYFAACHPWARASLVVDNNDVDAPFVASSAELT